MPLTITVDGVTYTATPDGTITPATIVATLVGDLLDTGDLIGPQTDELVGVTGTLDEYPQSVLAAFLDVAARLGLRVGDAKMPAPVAVTAGLGDGGFDALGNWHDPGSGEFARPGTSTAKAVVEHLFRKMLADAKRPGGVVVTLDNDHPDIGIGKGVPLVARYHDDEHADVNVRGITVRFPWTALTPEGGAYAKVRTPEGRETPTVKAFKVGDPVNRNGSNYIVTRRWRDPGMPAYEYEVQRVGTGVVNTFRKDELAPGHLPTGDTNDMPNRPTVAATTSWYETTIDGETIAPNVRTAEPPTFVLAARDKPGYPLRPVGYSTAATEADAIADAEAAAPYAFEHKVGPATVRDTPPPDEIRVVRRRDLDIEAEGAYRFHEMVTVNGYPAGFIRREDRGPDDDSGPISATFATSSEVLGPFDTRQDAIDAVVAHAAAPEHRGLTDTSGTITRQGLPIEFASIVAERVAALNKRAERKGLTGRVEFTRSDPYVSKYTDEAGFTHSFQATDITVTSTPVSLDGGWTFAGTVDYQTMREANPTAAPDDPGMVLLHSAAGYQLPERFRGPAVCDDCGRSMPRNKLVVAADADGNLTRLGTTCVRDVLGHDPAKLLWFSEATDGLMDDDEGVLLRPPPPAWEVEDFVAAAFIAADEFGWANAKSIDQTPTKNLLLATAQPPRGQEAPDVARFREMLDDPAEWDKARPKAAAAIAWVKSDAFRQRSEYEQNLHRAVTSELVTPRTAGIAASLVSQWQRHETQMAADAAREANVPNEWFGQIGDKIEMSGRVRSVNRYETMYGTKAAISIDTDRGPITTFVDANGKFADAADDAGIGGTIRFKATIKDHGEHPKGSGRKQTVIERAAHVPTRLDKLRAAEAEAAANREWEHSSAVRAVMQVVDQAAYAIGDPAALGAADPERQAWLGDMRSTLATLPAARLEQIAESAQAARTEFAAAHPPLANTGNVGMEAAVSNILDPKNDGMIVGYPKPSFMYRNGPTDGPLNITGIAQVRRTGDTVDLVDPSTGDVLVDDATLRSVADDIRTYEALPNEQRYGRTAIGDRPAIEKAAEPYDPHFSVVGKRGVKLPWDDTGYTVTVGRGDTERRVFIAPDGSVAEPLNEHESPWERAIREVNENAVRAQRTDMVAWLDAAVTEPYEAPADEGDVLNADNLADLTTPVEVTKGRKVYRIEAGGDVYTVPDGKRVTDKTGDPILRQALTDAGFEPPPAVVPEPPLASAISGEVNDLPDRPTGPRDVGSHEVGALAASPAMTDYRQALALDPHVALLRDAWAGGDVSAPGPTRAVQRLAAARFGLDPAMLGDTAAEDASILKSAADRHGVTDPTEGLARLYANTQALLADAGIEPDDHLALYRGVTLAQAADYEAAGRPSRIGSAPLAAFSTRFTAADANGRGGVVTVSVPAGNVVSIGVLGQPGDVVAHPDADGGIAVVRYRSAAEDAAAAAADIEVGEVLVATNGVKVLRTPSGFVDQATGLPVHADGTPIT